MKKWMKHWEVWREGILAITIVLLIYKLIDNLYPVWREMHHFLRVVRPFTIGFVIAYFLDVPCNKIEGKLGGKENKSARGISVFIVYLLLTCLIAVIMCYILPILIFNSLEFMNYAPIYMIDFIENLDENSPILVFIVEAVSEVILNLTSLQEIVDRVGSGLSSIGEYAIMMTTGVVQLFLSLIISIYLLLYKHKILIMLDQIANLFINKPFLQRIKHLLFQSNEIFYKFIVYQFLDAGIIAVLSIIVLSVLNVEYAFTLGILLGVCNMIPYFGSLFASAVAVVVTIFTGGPTLALIIGLFLLILQQIDGSIIGPRLMGDALNLNPILIILAITIGGAYFGIMGMFLSVPLAAIVKILISHGISLQNRKRQQNH